MPSIQNINNSNKNIYNEENKENNEDDSFYNMNFEEELDSYDKKILFEKSTDDDEYLKELETKMSDLSLKKERNIYGQKIIEILNEDLKKEKEIEEVLKEILNKLEYMN